MVPADNLSSIQLHVTIRLVTQSCTKFRRERTFSGFAGLSLRNVRVRPIVFVDSFVFRMNGNGARNDIVE